jgi:hypothetical protein
MLEELLQAMFRDRSLGDGNAVLSCVLRTRVLNISVTSVSQWQHKKFRLNVALLTSD